LHVHAADGGDVSALRGVGDLEVFDRQEAHRARSFGLRMSSRAYPIMVNARTTNTIARPGGTIHHQFPANGAPWPNAFSKIVPQEVWRGSPNPRNDSVASDRIAIATVSTVCAEMSGPTF